MSWVFQHSQTRGNDRLMLLAIADRVDDDGENCWQSTENLGRKAMVSKRTAQRCIDHLIEQQEIEVIERPGRSSVIRVLMGRDPGGDNLTPPPATRPTRNRGVKLTPRQVDTRDTRDARGASTVTPDTSMNHPLPPNPPQAGGGSRPHCPQHRRWRGACADCRAALDPPKQKPPWCGACDERTRLIDVDGYGAPIAPRRCPTCHPLTNPDRVPTEGDPS